MSVLRHLTLATAVCVSLAGCTDGYGYSGVSVGYGGYGGGDGFYDAGYYGGGYGSNYFGWYGDYYYPGTGIYVYDSYRRPYRWNDGQRSYWQGRARDWRGDRREIRDNWNDYARDRRPDDRAYGRDRREDYRAYRQGELGREQYRSDRRDDYRSYSAERHQDGRDLYHKYRRDRRR